MSANGTLTRNSISIITVHVLAALAIVLAPLPQTSAEGPGSVARSNLSGVPEGLTAAEWEGVQGLIRQAEYQLTWHEPSDAYTGPNRANGLWLALGGAGVQVHSADTAESWTWGLALTGYGTPGAIRPLSGAPVVSVDANRVDYEWDATLTEWYVNDERGLEQGFALAAPPAGTSASPLVLEMALDTDLVAELAADGQSIAFRAPAQTGWQPSAEVLRYDSLAVSDAAGRELPAQMRLSGCGGAAACRLELVIDATSASYPITVDPLVHSQAAKLTASDAEDEDWFGWSVAICGDTVVVGAPYENGSGTDRGAAYVYTRNNGSGDNWGQVKKLVASDAADHYSFGRSVAISGDTIVVSALLADTGAHDSGAAYVYARNQGGADNWGEIKKLIASDPGMMDWFGESVAISGDTLVAGAPYKGDDESEHGAAYVYARNHGGTADSWSQVKKLTPGDPGDGDHFGASVSISGDTLVVGAPWEDGAGSSRGAAYVFARNHGGADNWGQVQKLGASDAENVDSFGNSVSISGGTVVVGAVYEDGAGSDRGAAYVFARNIGGADNWGEVAKLIASDAQDYDWFGTSVAIDGSTVVVGAPHEDGAGTDRGAAYVFTAGPHSVYLPLVLRG